jgi:hypothetical protein
VFIKWRYEGPYKGYTRWYAYLAESKRINGKPRQKIITYLSSIDQDTDGDWIERSTFWYHIHRSLCLAAVTPGEYSKAMRKVGERIPLPTYQQWSQWLPNEHQQWINQHSHLEKKVLQTMTAVEKYTEAYSEMLPLDYVTTEKA